MARRVVYAEASGYRDDLDRALWVDRWIEIDWKHKIFIDGWSGDMAHQQPSYKVGLPGRTFEGDLPTLMEYGTIKDPEDVAWLQGATHGSYMTGTTTVEEVKDVMARVHQVGLRRDGRKGFAIEVLTGVDARDQINKDKREQAIATFKEVWWLIPIGLGALWLLS